MNEVLILASVVAPITLALVELIKRSSTVKNNLIPFVALVIGLLIGLAATPFTDLDVVYRLWAGGLSGLAAVGLFELGTKRDGNSKDVK